MIQPSSSALARPVRQRHRSAAICRHHWWVKRFGAHLPTTHVISRTLGEVYELTGFADADGAASLPPGGGRPAHRLLLVDVQLVLRGVQVEMFPEPFVKGRIDRLVALESRRLPDFDCRNRQPNARIPFFGPRQARRDHERVIAILFRRNAEKFGLVVVTRPKAFQATDRIAAAVHHFFAQIIFPVSVPSHAQNFGRRFSGVKWGNVCKGGGTIATDILCSLNVG